MDPGAILVVEDHAGIRAMVESTLAGLGHPIIAVGDGASAKKVLAEERVQLLVLDLNLPDIDGLQLLVDIVGERNLPVIITSARGAEDDRVLGLHIGADDYLTKPFSPRELAARVRALLRRADSGRGRSGAMAFGDLLIDTETREVHLKGDAIDLTRREFDLLATLASEPRRVFSRTELLERVWESRPGWQSDATVTEHVRRVRQKLKSKGDDGTWIGTVARSGYRFEP